jgi:asparagine synthase (glutamine-hydrolysing)
MCGILGLVSKQPVDRDAFSHALDALAPRGPDQHGTLFDGPVALGHRRLSVIDLTAAGRQPMLNEDGKVAIVYNGEVYNYKDIRKQLEPRYRWMSHTDTEVLVHGYEEWGQDLVDHIEGMFAFALWDREHQRLTLARDHFGKKPLYYYQDNATFAFAWELKALLLLPAVRAHVSIDTRSLQKYLLYGYIPSPHSIFREIRKVEPSTTLQFDLSEWRIVNNRRFWPLERIEVARELAEEDVLESMDRLIEDAVVKRLQADVPVGVFLSGGVDSSLIAAYVAKHAPSVEGFTVSYRSSPGADESRYAALAARHIGMKTHLCNFEDKDVEKSFVGILDYLDEPMADAAIIPLHFISKFARERVTVVLSGDGGDELFAGYAKYRAQLWTERLGVFSHAAAAAGKAVPATSVYHKFFRCLGLPFAARQFIFGSGAPLPDEARKLMPGAPFELETVFEDALAYDAAFGQRDVVNRSLFLDCRIQLPDWYLVKGDRATMAASLEMRNPLLDKALAEYMFRVPGAMKLKHGRSKYLLKKLAERYVDARCIYRPKRGFGVPLGRWIGGELRELFDAYLYRDNPHIDRDYVRALHDAHLAGRRDSQFTLLRVFNLNYFLERYGRV